MSAPTLAVPVPRLTDADREVFAEQYRTQPALSQSGMKDLAISPLRYWYLHINPEAPERYESPEMAFGTALHTLVLEGEDAFNARYTCDIDQSDFPGALVTIDDLRTWLKDKGHAPKGKLKAEIIQQAVTVDSSVLIWDVLQAQANAESADKTILPKADYHRVRECAGALESEPQVRRLLADGEAEVPLFFADEETGTPLKARLDWVSPLGIVDLKTFAQKRGKSIDQSVNDAIFYECYYRQSYLYSTLYQRITKSERRPRSFIVFVESDPPHEVRIKELKSSTQGSVNVYWQRAQIETRHFCRIWADCMSEFGTNPWRREQEWSVLLDEELPGLGY